MSDEYTGYDIATAYASVEAMQNAIYPIVEGVHVPQYNQFTVPQLEAEVDFWAFLKTDGVQNERGETRQRA